MENGPMRILLVDDEPDILEFVGFNLSREGYEVEKASNGRSAIEKAAEFLPHLILLDVMMPDMDGIETCQEIRKDERLKDVLICFLTARGEDYSQIAGFRSGADDYITKPVRPRVLVSRVGALLRRVGTQIREGENAAPGKLTLGDLIIDRESYSVSVKGETFHLPKKEFELLALLASKPGKVFSRDKILKKVWGDEVIVGDRTIDVHIRKVREKVGDSYIRTVKGVGYTFEF
jgi:two-component system, OmpR family, alkaline phosphatase synthesis response regulator PhoP